MNKDQIKKVLAGISMAGLITSIGLMSNGCQKSDTAKTGDEAKTEVQEQASCGQDTTQVDSTAKGSCGQGSCGQ